MNEKVKSVFSFTKKENVFKIIIKQVQEAEIN